MEKILVSWVGGVDLRAVKEPKENRLGPIVKAVDAHSFDRVHLISNYSEDETVSFKKWLESQTTIPIHLHFKSLSSPTNHGEIHEAVVDVLTSIKEKSKRAVKFFFHLSPGTPAMATVWVILSKTRFSADLIESSLEHGVQHVTVPFDLSAEFIPDLLKKSEKHYKLQTASLPSGAPAFKDIIYRCKAMDRAVKNAEKVAFYSVPVLLEGESGTGKELFARAIHEASLRKSKPFIAVNCGAIPSELIESQLFGHTRGAFTGAVADKKGFFEKAEDGSLFLDEVGELPLSAQVKLLRTLQEGEITQVGANSSKSINVRIIAATNKNLIEQISSGGFRSDLFYRLAVAIIRLPPLRERQGDLNLLIDNIYKQINVENKKIPGFRYKKISVSARNFLLEHTWPGNVRELRNTLVRAMIWADGDSISLEDVSDSILSANNSSDFGVLGRPIEDGFDLDKLLLEVGSHYLLRAYKEAKGNKTHAARMLGLSSAQTFKNRLKKHGIAI